MDITQERLQSFTTDDGLDLRYLDSALILSATPLDLKKPWLILIHGFTGTHKVLKRNIPALSRDYRVIAPDLRGHGSSTTPRSNADGGFDVKDVGVERLAKDLRCLITFLADSKGKSVEEWRGAALGGSLGCAIIWSYAHLYTTLNFTHTIFVDQSPLQNQIQGDWDPPYCHKGLRTASDFESFASTLLSDPEKAHLGTIHSCLGYLSHPLTSSELSEAEAREKYDEDRKFFLEEALKGDEKFLVELMRDHTALDHRDNITKAFGKGSGSVTKVLVVGSKKSGCFDVDGTLSVVGFVNGDEEGKSGRAKGEAVDWGGHWCYWEDPDRFDGLVLGFLKD